MISAQALVTGNCSLYNAHHNNCSRGKFLNVNINMPENNKTQEQVAKEFQLAFGGGEERGAKKLAF